MINERPDCDCGEAYAGGNCRSYCVRKQVATPISAPTPTLSAPASRWIAERRGKLYCAPACGGGCTWEQYQAAKAQAEALVDQLGADWTPQVHENLGWHAKAYYREALLLQVYTNGERYTASLKEGRWVATGTSPQDVVNKVIGQLLAEQAKLGRICEQLVGLGSLPGGQIG